MAPDHPAAGAHPVLLHIRSDGGMKQEAEELLGVLKEEYGVE